MAKSLWLRVGGFCNTLLPGQAPDYQGQPSYPAGQDSLHTVSRAPKLLTCQMKQEGGEWRKFLRKSKMLQKRADEKENRQTISVQHREEAKPRFNLK